MNHTEECINYNDNSFTEQSCLCNHKHVMIKSYSYQLKKDIEYCKICKVVYL